MSNDTKKGYAKHSINGKEVATPDEVEQFFENSAETLFAQKNADNLIRAKSTATILQPMLEKMLGEEPGIFESSSFGFVNLHTSDNLDGSGDGVWYPFNSAKTRHKGDTIMSRGDAVAQGIKIGS